MKNTVLLISLVISNFLQAQKFEKLALTPPMGWNSWNTFKCGISEQLVKDVVDAFITDGYQDAGYQYVNIDDCWMGMERDSLGNLAADPEKFPGGIKALADYVHLKDLKFGVYGCAGNKTCGGYPGNRGHKFQDARTYASWGVMRIVYMHKGIRRYSGPDHWNDFDMMEIGNGMTVSEDRTHFSLWCMLASPLIMGHDLRKATKETIEILTNKEVIAVNQDSGIQAFKYSDKDSIEIWAKLLDRGDWTVCFLNRNNNRVKI